jgi:hypothetical protein
VPPALSIVSFNNLFDVTDATMVRKEAGAYSVELGNPRTAFRVDDPTGGRSGTPRPFAVAELSGNRYRLVLEEGGVPPRLLYYSQGRMIEMEAARPESARAERGDPASAGREGDSALLSN